MMSKHFELTDETMTTPSGVTLHRIRATRDLPQHGVRVGDLGGWIETEDNLSGGAWVSGGAQVYGGARVSENARVSGDAQVYGDAWVFRNAQVSGGAWVYGNAWVGASQDVLTLGPIGSESVTITLHRTSTGHALRVGCWSGTLDTLMQEVDSRSDDWGGTPEDHERWRAEYTAAHALLSLRARAWEGQ